MNNEIILINNNSYGAPELKKSYQGFTLKGFIVAVAFHVALITAYMLFAYVSESKANDIPVNKNERKYIIQNFDPHQDEEIQETEQPVIKKDDVVQQVKDLAALEPKPVATTDADNVRLKSQNELDNINGTVHRTGDSSIASNNTTDGKIVVDNSKIDSKIDIKQPPVDIIYKEFEVEKAPECVNLQQVKSSIKYPELAREIGTEGRVTIKVLVSESGSVIKTGAITGDEIFHDEVKEKARDLQFTSGMQNNKPVKVWVTIPFNFKLK